MALVEEGISRNNNFKQIVDNLPPTLVKAVYSYTQINNLAPHRPLPGSLAPKRFHTESHAFLAPPEPIHQIDKLDQLADSLKGFLGPIENNQYNHLSERPAYKRKAANGTEEEVEKRPAALFYYTQEKPHVVPSRLDSDANVARAVSHLSHRTRIAAVESFGERLLVERGQGLVLPHLVAADVNGVLHDRSTLEYEEAAGNSRTPDIDEHIKTLPKDPPKYVLGQLKLVVFPSEMSALLYAEQEYRQIHGISRAHLPFRHLQSWLAGPFIESHIYHDDLSGTNVLEKYLPGGSLLKP